MNTFEKVAVAVGHGFEWPFTHGAELVEDLATALKDEPAAKAAITGLVEQIEVLSASASLAIATKGTDIPGDLQAISAAETLWKYVIGTFIPEVESVYTDFKTIADEPAPVAPVATDPVVSDPAPVAGVVAAATAEADAVDSPGLHNVVPA